MNFDVLSSWSGDLTSRNMVTQGQYDASAQLQTLCDRPVSLMMASASAEPGKSVKGDGEGQSVQFASGNNTMVRAWENPSGQRVVTDVYRPGCGASALNSPGIAAASELQRR